MSTKNIGKVVQVIGPVLDIRFQDGQLPELLSAIEIQNGDRKIVAEVAQHIGDNVARCISMNATDGMVRGMDAVDTGGPITVPVGDKCLGRIFNLLGQPIDEKPAPEGVERWPIHRQPPSFEEQETSTEILETGIKVVDLIAPYAKGGKIGLFGGAGISLATPSTIPRPARRMGTMPTFLPLRCLALVLQRGVSISTSLVGRSRVTSYTISMLISSSSSRNSLAPV